MPSDDPIVATFEQMITVSLYNTNVARAQKALNNAWIGHDNCWKRTVVAGSEQMKPIVDNPKAYEKLSKAHRLMNMSQQTKIRIHLHKSGNKTIEIV